MGDRYPSVAPPEPDRTARQLFERLQAQHPGAYNDGQLRTLQRRLKAWRRAMARNLVVESLSNDESRPKKMAARKRPAAATAAGSTAPD